MFDRPVSQLSRRGAYLFTRRSEMKRAISPPNWVRGWVVSGGCGSSVNLELSIGKWAIDVKSRQR